MVEKTKNKIISSTHKIIAFFKANLAQIIFVMLAIQFVTALRSIPYVNVIPNLFYYSIIFVLFLILVFFRIVIPNKQILKITLVLFAIAFGVVIFEMKEIADFLGFVIYILLGFCVTRAIIQQRVDLRQETK